MVERTPGVPRFRTVVLDADSTLAGIEGIDWLAARRGDALARRVAELTEAAMSGRVAIETVYGARVREVAPSREDIDALSAAYCDARATGAAECVGALQRGGVRVLLLSGGVREALLPLARATGIAESDVHAVHMWFEADGTFGGFDADSPLTKNHGKGQVLKSFREVLPRPILHVGDGVTDAEAQSEVDAFAAYVGFTRRDAVVARADFVVESFGALRSLVLGQQAD